MAFNPNYYPYYTPQYNYQPQQPIFQPQQQNGIIWVQGEAGAKAFPVRPGESAFLVDSENPRAYLKSCDISGVPSMKYYNVNEIPADQVQIQPQPTQHPEYATADDLNKLRDEMSKIRKSLKSIKATVEGEDNE